jgi:hypothetical protein
MARGQKGRPPLDPHDRSVEVMVSMPSKKYDAIYTEARTRRISIPELIRDRVYRIYWPSDLLDASCRLRR